MWCCGPPVLGEASEAALTARLPQIARRAGTKNAEFGRDTRAPPPSRRPRAHTPER